MVGEAISGLSAFNSMLGIAKSMKDMNDAIIRNKASYELWEQILAAQERYSAALEKISALEKEVAGLKAWDTEKERYQLQEVAFGAVAYVMKDFERGTEPAHLLCANCYQDNKKRFLQAHRSDASFIYRKCQECGSEIRVPKPPSPPRQAIANTRYDPLGKWR